MSYKIAIVGASFAGLSACISLKKAFPDAKIYLFDKEKKFTYIPSSHLLLTRKNKLRNSQVSLKKYFSDVFIHEEVLSISDSKVKTKSKEYDFDFAVIASGAQVQYFGNKNLQEHAYGAKSLSHLKTLWKVLPKAKKVVVIGSGLSGVEYASMLAYDTKKEVILINSADLVLPNLHEVGRRYAQKWLERHGVKVINNVMVVDASPSSVTLNNKQVVKADLILQCTGLKQVAPFFETQEVDEYLAHKQYQNIFLCGDVVRTKSVPTAHSAMVEGQVVAKQIIARIKGEDPKVPRLEHPPTLAVALGPRDGFLQLNKTYIPGPFIGFLKWLIEQSVIFSFKKRIKLF